MTDLLLIAIILALICIGLLMLSRRVSHLDRDVEASVREFDATRRALRSRRSKGKQEVRRDD